MITIKAQMKKLHKDRL